MAAIGDLIDLCLEGCDCHVAVQPRPNSAWLPMARDRQDRSIGHAAGTGGREAWTRLGRNRGPR
jgi:hypothetical protein